MKHRKTGKWIIGHSKKYIEAEEIGCCIDGSMEIDFEKKPLTCVKKTAICYSTSVENPMDFQLIIS